MSSYSASKLDTYLNVALYFTDTSHDNDHISDSNTPVTHVLCQFTHLLRLLD